MAKAKKTVGPAVEIRKLLGTGKLVIGTERVIKGLKRGEITKVLITSNCPEDVKEDITNYAKISKAEVVQLKIPNDEMGVVCKKPFSISVAGIMKE